MRAWRDCSSESRYDFVVDRSAFLGLFQSCRRGWGRSAFASAFQHGGREEPRSTTEKHLYRASREAPEITERCQRGCAVATPGNLRAPPWTFVFSVFETAGETARTPSFSHRNKLPLTIASRA